jgi:DNA-binding FadR family transcriptional regulator
VRNPNLSDQVAEMILDTIRSAGLHSGDRLPSEREFADQLGVSRTVIREAIRSLAGKGIVEIRSGSGIRVASFDPSSVSEAMGHLIRSGEFDIDYEKVHAVRQMIEVEVAGRAAVTAQETEIDSLEQLLNRSEALIDDVEAFSNADVEFHRGIAQLTHNELFVIMLDSIGDVMLDIRRATSALPGEAKKAAAFHRRILEQISARDSDGAREAMREHLDHSNDLWRQRTHAGG